MEISWDIKLSRHSAPLFEHLVTSTVRDYRLYQSTIDKTILTSDDNLDNANGIQSIPVPFQLSAPRN